MEEKLNKYYNYIADDLFMKTEIEDDMVIDYPHSKLPEDADPEPVSYFTSFSSPSLMFERYVMERYGVMVEESRIIWYLYKKRFK
jgi:hypothetical protein|tara:strand:- start:2706 stop:2960 length:255 start_codon:yes stop_codon:yes gene_type:complete